MVEQCGRALSHLPLSLNQGREADSNLPKPVPETRLSIWLFLPCLPSPQSPLHIRLSQRGLWPSQYGFLVLILSDPFLSRRTAASLKPEDLISLVRMVGYRTLRCAHSLTHSRIFDDSTLQSFPELRLSLAGEIGKGKELVCLSGGRWLSGSCTSVKRLFMNSASPRSLDAMT